MDNTTEDTFEGLTTGEVVQAAIVGVAVTVGIIVAVKVVKYGINRIKASKDAPLWEETPEAEPANEN